MKRRFHLLLLLLLCLGRAASADSIRRFEVFIDTDPGVGNGTIYSVASASQADIVAANITVSMPTGIAPGRHTLYIRSYGDTASSYGHSSLVQARPFFVAENIIAAEYFFDTDPGLGLGTAISVAAPADTVALTASIATTGLQPGWHSLYVRTKNNSGKWSAAFGGRRFFVQESITAGEYFFDTDPGNGNGAAFAIATPSDTVSKSFSAATPASMPDGKHILYVRTKSAGKWSLAQGRDFFLLPRINAAEYFFDNDPGVGQGTALSVSPVSDTVNGAYSISTTGLSGGQHRLYVRSRSASGRWSSAHERAFYVRPKIVAAEYFWDTDPGTGSGIALSVSMQSDTVAQSYTIKAPCLAPGTHHIYIRMKDEFGHWGIAQEDTATFSNPAVVANATYPGPGPYGTPVKVLGSGGIPPYTYRMGSGAAGADSVFLPANNASVSFTAIDTCGYSGTANITTPAKPTIIAGGSTGSGSITLTGYRYWAYVQDAGGNIIGAIRDNRQSLGTLTMSYLKNNSGTVRTYPFNPAKYLDRNWFISSGNAPAGNVGVQLFAVDSEYNALAAADPLVTSKSTLRVNKYDGANEDLSIANNSGIYVSITPDSIVTFSGATTPGNGYALAFSISDFSEFYESRSTAVPLSLQSVMLKAEMVGGAIQLSWHTEGGQNTARQILSRSADGRDMQEISAQASGNGVANDYRYLDEQPLPGANYYRVTVEDRDGSQHYSEAVMVRIGEGRMLSLAPNPAQDAMRISGLQAGDGITLRDIAGRTVWQSIATGAAQSLDTRSLAGGIYMLVIDADGTRIMQRVEIAH